MDPPPLDNGKVTVTSDIVGAMAEYICDDGYRFSTPDTSRTCQMDGTWSEEEIVCESGK